MTTSRPFETAARLGFALAIVFAAASAGNIILPDAYARETPSWNGSVPGGTTGWTSSSAALLLFAAALARSGRTPGAITLCCCERP